MLKRIHFAAGLLLATLLSATAMTHAGDTLDRVVASKTLTVGTSADQPPLTARNRQGNFMGLDIDLAKALANAMGVELKVEQMDFSDLLGALDSGKVDMVMSGVAITPERAMRASFVGPYMLSIRKSRQRRREACGPAWLYEREFRASRCAQRHAGRSGRHFRGRAHGRRW
jgi:polar amino acid transport system substrate-binding protein